MNGNREEVFLCKRIKDLAQSACYKNIACYTDFLNINEIHLFHTMKQELPPVKSQLWGGYKDAERRVICFYTDDSFRDTSFPIHTIMIKPAHIKFSDKLTHRDYLGAILNLGIERHTLGDIIVNEEETYLFCKENISSYILENLLKIKHTYVNCNICNPETFIVTPKFTEINGTVASKRLDAVLAIAFHSSRSNLTQYILAGKVYVNSRLVESPSFILKDNDVVSVRGLGKFMFQDVAYVTKKGRMGIKILKYI